MKRKNLIFLLAPLLLVSLLTGCQSGGSQSEISIGIIQDLTGPTATWGEAVVNGATLAVEDLNAKGGLLGKKIKLVPYDFKGDVKEALTAYTRLVEQDKVVAVIGTPNSAAQIAMAPIADEKKIPIVGDPIDERATTPAPGKVYKYTFLAQPSASSMANTIASYGLNELKLKRVAVLYDQGNPYSVSLAGPFVDYYVRNGGTVVASEPFQSGTKDFRPQLTKIKQLNPEAIHLTTYLQEDVLIAKQMRELGMNMPILGNNACNVPFAQLAGEAANGTVYVITVSINDPRAQPVAKRYKERFGKDPVIHTVFMGYDNMALIANAIKKANKLDPVAIRDALENNTIAVEALTDKITFDPATHRPVDFPLSVVKIENGQYVLLKDKYLPVIK